MLAVKHDELLPYPVSQEWCGRVRDTVEKMGRGGYARLAEFCSKRIGRQISSGHLAEVLNGKYQTSDLVGPIHEFLAWHPPMSPTAALEAGEAIHIFQRLTPAQRELSEEAMHVLEGASGEQARRALGEMLKLFKATKKND